MQNSQLNFIIFKKEKRMENFLNLVVDRIDYPEQSKVITAEATELN